MRMRLEVLPAGKATATVILTQDQVDKLRGTPGRGRVPLAITYGGKTFRTSVAVYRGQWMTVVNAEMRDAGLTPGGTYACDVAMDTAERTVEVPKDLQSALKAAGLTTAFDALSYTHQREHVRHIESAVKPETRQRRIERTIAHLSGDK